MASRLRLALCGAGAGLSVALDNGLARTPPMGWLSWEYDACNLDCVTYPDQCINADLYKHIADRLANDGWKELGYEYVNIDDCWPAVQRDASNNVVPDPERFPDGIKAVCDYIHSKGLKCGLYTDIGTLTCGGYPGLNITLNQSQARADIERFASWGIDSLKVDGCYQDAKRMPIDYPAVAKLLNETGRQILYSCSWPAYISDHMTPEVYESLKEHCNLWRNWNDISDSWDSVHSIIGWWRDNQVMAQYAGPGNWNDPDMILVGGTGLSYEQQKVQLTMWAIFAAPLYMSNDLFTLSPELRALAQNKDMVAVNQDPLGSQGSCVRGCTDKDTLSVWTKKLQGGHLAVAVLNLHAGVPDYPVASQFTAADLGIPADTKVSLLDVWSGQRSAASLPYSMEVGSTAVRFFIISTSDLAGVADVSVFV